jgi:hypothetical protein
MRKLILSAALIAAMFSAKAQTVTTKCGCQTDTAKLEKWIYSRTDSTELFQSPEWNTWVEFDWKNNQVRVRGGQTYPMRQYETSAEEPKVTVWYGTAKFTVLYDKRSRYAGHTVE